MIEICCDKRKRKTLIFSLYACEMVGIYPRISELPISAFTQIKDKVDFVPKLSFMKACKGVEMKL